WSCDFELNDNPLKPKVEGTAFSVLVEEVQPMLPATYTDEPIVDKAKRSPERESLVFSGPRFAALIALTEPVGAGKKAQGGEPNTPAKPRPTPPQPRGATGSAVSRQ